MHQRGATRESVVKTSAWWVGRRFCAPSGLVSLQQTFSVSFELDKPGATNQIIYRSGMPGYVVGKPVLVGRLINCADDGTCSLTSGSVVSQFQNGLQLMERGGVDMWC